MKRKICDVTNIVLLSMMLVACDSCKEDPYIDIDYQLDCPSVLLEYATPQVTYKGNNGAPITFTIPGSEWTETDDYAKTTIVIDGDTIISGANKKMRWTKQVQYVNVPIVDDEITVVYIPKESIPMGNTTVVTGLKPTLIASVKIIDEDGKNLHPTNVNVNTDITINGNIVRRTLADMINSYCNYKGFHIESDGTCEDKEFQE